MRQSTFLRRVIRALMDAGYENFVVDFGDQRERVTSIAAAIKELKSVDDAYLTMSKDGQRSWIRVVWQGPDATYQEGEEIVADYTTNLEPVIGRLCAEAGE